MPDDEKKPKRRYLAKLTLFDEDGQRQAQADLVSFETDLEPGEACHKMAEAARTHASNAVGV